MTPRARAAWEPIRNPIKHLVRRAFRRNRADTSPRLVYPALSAGYRALALLREARASSYSRPNDAHASILQLLRDRQRERQRSLFAKAAPPPHSPNPPHPPKPSSAPREDALPLLVRVSPPAPASPASSTYVDPTEPQPAIQYETPHRPRPLSELGGSGRRKVPHIDMGGDYPFLRLKKPQPGYLSRMLTQKIRTRVRRTVALNEIEAALDDAVAEDDWERTVEGLLARHTGRLPPSGGGGSRTAAPNPVTAWDDPIGDVRLTTASGRKVRVVLDTETYAGSAWRHGHQHIEALLSREKEDLIARAAAMRELVHQERRLAEQEKADRKAERRRRWEERMRAEGRAAEFGIAEVAAAPAEDRPSVG